MIIGYFSLTSNISRHLTHICWSFEAERDLIGWSNFDVGGIAGWGPSSPPRGNIRKNNKSRAVCAYSDTLWASPQSPCDNEHVGPLQCSLRSTLYNCPVLETNVNQYERLNKRRHDCWDATVCSTAPSPRPGGIFLTWIMRFYCSLLYSLKT